MSPLSFTLLGLFLCVSLHPVLSLSASVSVPIVTEAPLADTINATDWLSAMKAAAAGFNVPSPANWAALMNPSTTNGALGHAQVGASTVESVMANWNLPAAFRADAVKNVQLLVLAATEGTYLAKSFVFNTAAQATSLTTLLVVTTRDPHPADPDQPVAVAYVTITANAAIKQQYTPVHTRSCHRCPKCVWSHNCCCHDVTTNQPRGDTPAELTTIQQQLKASSYAWFLQNVPKSLTVLLGMAAPVSEMKPTAAPMGAIATLEQIIASYIARPEVKAEVLASYPDPIISALQANMTTLKQSSQALNMDRVDTEHVEQLLSTLASDYGFEQDFRVLLPHYVHASVGTTTSYETIFAVESDDKLTLRYVWLVGQAVDSNAHSFEFLHTDLTSTALVQTLLSNGTMVAGHLQPGVLVVTRVASVAADGQFQHSTFPSLTTSWPLNTTTVVMDMFRWSAANTLVPTAHPLLSYFNLTKVTPADVPTFQPAAGNGILDKIGALTNAVKEVCDTWKDVASAFKTVTTVSIQRIIRLGFTYFNEQSSVMKAVDIPADKEQDFVNAVIGDYKLPSQGSFMLGLTYSADFTWDSVQYVYSPNMNGVYRTLILFKNGDSTKNTASFLICDIHVDWTLAPDLLLIHKHRSVLGGIWESDKDSIQEVPHALTLDDAQKLEDFFRLTAFGKMGEALGLGNLTYPSLN